MIGSQPAITAPMTAARPTPPAPNTAMLAPAGGASAVSTAPAPVCRPQPNGPSNSSGARSETLTAPRSGTITWWLKEDWPKKWALSSAP